MPGKLVRLEVKDFKSYRGHHVLVFGDSYFTSIIGPNGSGKSNSMDAISFVLGIKSQKIRSDNLRDLIYRGRVLRTSKINADGTATEQATNGDGEGTQIPSQRNDPQTAWVMAVYHDTELDEEHTWKRTITSAGTSEYHIDNRPVSQKAYNKALEDQYILIKAKNFLVFQGDVEKIASQTPKDLTAFIEKISGSDEYKSEYERLKQESEAAHEDQSTKLTERRQINAEIKQYQEQKREAEEYERKTAELEQANVTRILWKLFHFEQRMRESGEEIQKHQDELKEHRRSLEKYHEMLENAKQEQARATREVSRTERAIKGKERETEEAEKEVYPIEQSIATASEKVSQQQARVLKIMADRDKQAELVKHHKQKVEKIKKAQEIWEAEWKQQNQREGREPTEADRQEYNRLKIDVTKRISADKGQVNDLSRRLATAEETTKNLKSKAEGPQSQVAKLDAEIADLVELETTTNRDLKKMKEDLNTQKIEGNKLAATISQSTNKRKTAEDMLRIETDKRKQMDFGQRESKRERAFADHLANLKRLHAGAVHGRLRDLCKPKQAKYQKAISVVFGGNADAIVVNNQDTASSCIEFTKEQHQPSITFLPLETISIEQVNSNVKGKYKGVRLTIDTIEYDSKYGRAMEHVCGSSIICDTREVAKDMQYNKNVGGKAVDLEGTVYRTDTMEGGSVPETKSSSQKWGSETGADIDVKIAKWLEHFQQHSNDLREAQEKQSKLTSASVQLQNEYTQKKAELNSLRRNLEDRKNSHRFFKNQLNESQPKYEEGLRAENDLRNDLKSFQDAIAEVEDEVFSSWCQRLGYSNIRDYEARQGSLNREADQKKLEFSNNRRVQESYLQSTTESLKGFNERVQNLEDSIKKHQDQIATLEAQKEEMEDKLDQLRAELEQLNETLNTQTETSAEKAAAVTKQRQELNRRNKAVEGIMKEVRILEDKVKKESSLRYDLLRECRIKGTELPLEEGSKDLDSLPLDDVQQDDVDAMDVDDEEADVTMHVAEVPDYGIELDFSELDEDLQEDDSEDCDTKLKDAITALESALSKMNFNSRVDERLNSVNTRNKAMEKDFEAAKRAAKHTKEQFEEVREKRLDIFNRAVEHIQKEIKTTYGELTRDHLTPDGGKAALEVDDPDEPYLAGLRYSAMPPLKRYREMESLSGGEKTIAALALLFAIHSFRPSPFFVLDEIDAALDNVNVARVARYVQKHAKPGMQFIVISLKPALFQESDSLVGVMRDQSKMSSRVVSLNLKKYLPNDTRAVPSQG